MAHILPHWTWPERVGKVTPVHVFSAADEAELFLNNESLGRRKKGAYNYRFRWDSIIYKPGKLRVVTWKEGKLWACDTVRTAGEAAQLKLVADKTAIKVDGEDLAFITLQILDKRGLPVPEAGNTIEFEISPNAEIVATDNGSPADLTAFVSTQRKAFNGLALVIVRAKTGQSGAVTVTAKSKGLGSAQVKIRLL